MKRPEDLTMLVIECYVHALAAIVRNGTYSAWAYSVLRDHDEHAVWRETIFKVITTPTKHLTPEEVVWRTRASIMLADINRA